MISFCCLVVPPSKRRSSATQNKKIIIELYSHFQDIAQVFDQTNYTSIGSFSQFIANRHSLRELSSSLQLNGDINVYGTEIDARGTKFLLLFYYQNAKYLDMLTQSSNVQLLDTVINTFLNIFVHSSRNRNVHFNVLRNIQNTIDLLQNVNAQNSYEPNRLVYWDNKCKNYTHQIIDCTPNKQPIQTSIFQQNAYSHTQRRYGDFFGQSKYKRSNSYHNSNAQKNVVNRSKWTRKSTTFIGLQPSESKTNDSNTPRATPEKDKEKQTLANTKYGSKLTALQKDLTNFVGLIAELRLDDNDDMDNDEIDLDISQSVTRNTGINIDIDFEPAIMSIEDTSQDLNVNLAVPQPRRARPSGPVREKVVGLPGLPGLGGINFKHHRKMSDVLIPFHTQCKEAYTSKQNIINSLKDLLNEIEKHSLPSFDDDKSDSEESSNENDIDKEEQCRNWLKLATNVGINENIVLDGLEIMQSMFDACVQNNVCKDLYAQINEEIVKYVSSKEQNQTAVLPKSKRHSRHVRKPTMMELKAQFNDMMGTIGDDKQFKAKLTDLFAQVSDGVVEPAKDKKRASLRIFPVKDDYINRMVQIEKAFKWAENNATQWDFDPINFSKDSLIGGNCVVILGWHLIKINNWHTEFGISVEKLIHFLYQIQEAYRTNVYHNKFHACDVMNNVYWFLNNTPSIAKYITSFDKLICVLAAAIHDVDHNGKNNDFHKQTGSYLAIRYNDASILENHHIAYAFKLISSDEGKNDWISDLKKEELIEDARKYLIRLIIDTDMAVHNKHLSEIKELTEKMVGFELELAREDKMKLLSAIVHACDIGNAAKERGLCVEWAKRCINEFREQGDEEVEKFGEESQLLFSRTHPLEKSQLGWIQFVMNEYFTELNKLLSGDIQVLLDNLNHNAEEWDKYKEFGCDQKDDQ